MADYNPSVALQSNAPDPQGGLNTLSKIMSLGQQGLEIRGKQSSNISAAAKATVDQQNATEKMAGVQLLSDPVGNGLVDADGNPTKDAQRKIMQAMPTTGAEHYQGILTGAKSKVEYNKSVNNLASDERAEIGNTLAGAAADPKASPETISAALDGLVETKKGTPVYDDYKRIADTASHVVDHTTKAQLAQGKIIPPGQEAYRQSALSMARPLLGAGGTVGAGGIATPQGAQVDTGENIQPGTTAPPLAGGGFTPAGAPIKKVAPPGYTVLPNGQLARISGGATSATPIPVTQPPAAPGANAHPRTAQDDAPPANAPKAVQEAYSTATTNANSHVDSVRTADETYGNNKAIANAVRTLSSGAKTGPGTETWNHVMGVLGTKGANDYQELGAFLDRQAATVRGQMGLPGTNAGAEDAKMIAGNTKYNAKVIQDKNNYTEALTDGLHMYRNGLDRVAGFSGQASPAQVSKFKSAWTNAFDPNVLIGENAYKRSKTDGDTFVASLDPKEAASLKAKRQAMLELSSGKLPQ